MEEPVIGKGVSYLIRDFALADQAATKQLILNGLVEHWGFLDQTLNPDLENISDHYRGNTFLVAELAGEVVGSGALVHENEGVARIVRMSVACKLRRKGIGRAILERLLLAAREKGYRKVVLETTETWLDAITFYERNGFRTVGFSEGDRHFELDL